MRRRRGRCGEMARLFVRRRPSERISTAPLALIRFSRLKTGSGHLPTRKQ